MRGKFCVDLLQLGTLSAGYVYPLGCHVERRWHSVGEEPRMADDEFRV